MARYVLADLGSGQQLIELEVGGYTWLFDRLDLFGLHPYHKVNAVVDPVLTPATFGTPVVTNNGVTFSLTWTNAEGSSVLIIGTLVEAESYLKLEFNATLAGADATTYAIHSFEVPALAIKPYEIPTKELQCCAVPTDRGYMQRDMTRLNAKTEMTFPLATIYPDSANTGTYGQFDDWCLHYHEGAQAGLLIVAMDAGNRFKRFTIFGDGTNVVCGLTHYPANNAATASYALQYEVRLYCIRARDYWDGVQKVRELQAAHQNFSRGKIAAAPIGSGVLGERWSRRIEEADIFLYTRLGDSKSTANANAIVADYGRLIGYAGSPGLNAIHFDQNGWMTTFGSGWPHRTLEAVGEQFLKDMAGKGATNYLYNPHELVDPAGPWAGGDWTQTGSVDPATLVKVDPAGTPFINGTVAPLLPGGAPNPAYAPLNALNLGTPGSREHVINILAELMTGRTSYVHGFYLDAFFATIGVMDFRSTLAGVDRGQGTTYLATGVDTFLRDLRVRLRLLHPDADLISENVSMPFAGRIPMQSLFAFDIFNDPAGNADRRRVPVKAAYGSGYGYHWHSGGETGALDPTQPVYNNSVIFNLVRALDCEWFGYGSPISFLLTSRTDTRVAAVGDGSDPEPWYTNFWLPYQKPYIDWALHLTRLRKLFRHYFRGTRLRDLPGSWEAVKAASGYNVDLLPPFIKWSDVNQVPYAHAWYTDEQAFGTVGIFVHNWTDSVKTFPIIMDSTRFPMLDRGRLFEANQSTGARTLVKEFISGFTHEVTLPARTSWVGEALLQTTWPRFRIRPDGVTRRPDGTRRLQPTGSAGERVTSERTYSYRLRPDGTYRIRPDLNRRLRP